jgi:ADP-ribosyl-[dinitrogen reductase] hydrolase
MDGAAEIACRWIDLYNDPHAFGSDRHLDLCAEDVDWQEMPSASSSGFRGDKAALRAGLAAAQGVLRNRHAELEELIADAGDQVCAFRYRGSAELGIDVPPYRAGARFETEVAQFIEVRNGLIVRGVQYSARPAGARPNSEPPPDPRPESRDSSGRWIRGSCLCGTVSFELDKAGIVWTNACFCSYCRKVSGSQFIVAVHVRPESFRWLSGEDQVGAFESSPGNMRGFCRICGSIAPVCTPFEVKVPGGALDDDPGVAPTVNIYTASTARWCAAATGARQSFPRVPTAAEFAQLMAEYAAEGGPPEGPP